MLVLSYLVTFRATRSAYCGWWCSVRPARGRAPGRRCRGLVPRRPRSRRLGRRRVFLAGDHALPTVSYGIATLEPSGSLESTIARADSALYRAKALGRDCVVHHRPGSTSRGATNRHP
jgi:hypothetical protein